MSKHGKIIGFFLIQVIMTAFFLISCKSTPPSLPESTEEIQIIAKNEENIGVNIDNSISETGEIVQRAEELVSPIVLDYNFVLDEPLYPDNQMAEIIELSDTASADENGSEGENEFDLGNEPPYNEANEEIAGTEQAKEVIEEAAVKEEEKPAPPPSPPRFIRPAEPITEKTEPPQSVKPAPILTARNPPTETNPKRQSEFSRTVKALTNQLVEIPFKGSGWIFLGEQNNVRGLPFDARRSNDDGQSFVFRAEKSGTYVLQFYKQDFLRGDDVNDYVRVIVEDAPKLEVLQIANGTPQNESVNGKLENTGNEEEYPQTENQSLESPADILKAARTTFGAGKFPETIELLDKLSRQVAEMDDEALWLYAQSFEAKTPVRDIRAALDFYTRLMREYPQSKYYKSADNRAAYLKKFYFNIR